MTTMISLSRPPRGARRLAARRYRQRTATRSYTERTTRRWSASGVYYPTTEGAAFDHDYYREKHMPLAVKTWGLDGGEIDKGVDGPYVAAVHFKFESPGGMDAMDARPPV